MKLRNQILISIASIWTVFLIMTYTGSQYFLIHSYLELEKDHANQDLTLIDQALKLNTPLELKRIAANTKHNLTVLLPHQIHQSTTLTQVYQTLAATKLDHHIIPVNQQSLEGYTLIRDSHDHPIGMFKLVTPRPLYLSGLKAIQFYLVSFIALGIFFSLVMMVLLRKLIIRIETQTQELKHSNQKLKEEITERKSVEQELMTHKEHLVRLAHYDALTSLPNRIYFNEMLNRGLSHANRQHTMAAILFIDLDRFKKINDTLGHQTGDMVLKEIANRFTAVLRAEDVLARLGGDEFIVLLNDIKDAKSALPVAEKILQTCTKPIIINTHEFYITVSIGISLYPSDGNSLETLQKNADIAMYKAKLTGGNHFQYFTREMDIEAHEHMELEALLRKAIKNQEFVLHYQPKMTIHDGLIIGVEALIRWENSELGIISPSKFIPIAEETGLIMEIGEWALRQACQAAKSWQDQGYQPVSVAVNLSPKQFRHQDIAELVASILRDSQLPAQYLELEITENTVMDNVASATEKLNAIKHMGVAIAIDDFGTGYSSINYLKQFPIDIIKIDQHFIKGITDNKDDAAIISAIIALAHSLKIKVVAEGVETEEQLQFLADQNCDIAQGYFLSRPLPEQKLLAQLLKAEDTLM